MTSSTSSTSSSSSCFSDSSSVSVTSLSKVPPSQPRHVWQAIHGIWSRAVINSSGDWGLARRPRSRLRPTLPPPHHRRYRPPRHPRLLVPIDLLVLPVLLVPIDRGPRRRPLRRLATHGSSWSDRSPRRRVLDVWSPPSHRRDLTRWSGSSFRQVHRRLPRGVPRPSFSLFKKKAPPSSSANGCPIHPKR